jgi:hypothetical protein
VIDRCRVEMPQPTEWAADHLVACHRAAELPEAAGIGVDHVSQTAARRMALYAQRREAAGTASAG